MRLQAEAEASRRAYNQEVVSQNLATRKENLREWDLNDPDALKKMPPMRDGDHDPKCGPASMLKFDGEDIYRKERMAANRVELLRAWQAQQMDIKDRATVAAAMDKAQQDRLEAYTAELHRVAANADDARKRMQRDLAQANADLAAATADRRAHEEELEALAKEAELANNASDPWLTEHPGATVNPSGTLRKDNYKGMSTEERKGIMEVQAMQVEAKKAAKLAAAERELEDARQGVMVKRAMDEAEQRRRAFAAQQNGAMKSFLDAQKVEKKEKDAQLRETYRNEVTDGFFNQFGQSDR
jgi:hypothetical protein